MAAATTVSLTLRDMGERVAHAVHAAALPGCTDDTRDRAALRPACASRDDELDAVEAAGLVRRAQEVRPERSRLPTGPTPRPMISRRPSVVAATAIIAATETIRPPSTHASDRWHRARHRAIRRSGRRFEELAHALVNILAQLRDTVLFEMPERPMACARSRRRARVDTPPIQASWITATSACSDVLRGLEEAAGSNCPARSFGILRLSDPSRVSSVRSR